MRPLVFALCDVLHAAALAVTVGVLNGGAALLHVDDFRSSIRDLVIAALARAVLLLILSLKPSKPHARMAIALQAASLIYGCSHGLKPPAPTLTCFQVSCALGWRDWTPSRWL